VDALGPPVAERATRHDPARSKGKGNRGVIGIKVPSFEPNPGPVRQKVRKKVHSPYLATPAPIIKNGQEPKIGAKVVTHGRYVTFQMAEVAVSQQMLADILSPIARLRARPGPA
jgi:hypothetical protein